MYTENLYTVRSDVICVEVWYSRGVLLSLNLIFYISVFFLHPDRTVLKSLP